MDITSNRHGGADTSVLAFASTPTNVRSRHRFMILEKIKEVGDATCSEIEKILNMSHQTASARISELKRDGNIIDTGKRRLTSSGRSARVYKINEVENGMG